MGAEKSFEDRISEIPGEHGFWKSASKQEFLRIGLRLEDLGLDEDEVIEVLRKLYWSTAACYGH